MENKYAAFCYRKLSRIFRRNLSAIGEKIWYFFQIRYSFVSSLGDNGRNTSPESADVSTR